jgi:formylglycine-generating enzyme required for sulfatase activity
LSRTGPQEQCAAQPAVASENHAYELFAIFAAVDGDFVRGYLLPSLKLPRARVLLVDELTPGEPTLAELERGILFSRYTIVVLSPAYLQERWTVIGEHLSSYASIGNSRMVPLRLTDCLLPLRLEACVSLDFTKRSRWDEEVVRLRDLFGSPSLSSEEQIECPYPGLRAFSVCDFSRFFGREREIEDLVGRLDRGERAIYVIGPSGSGKSSLVQAGLLHALENGKSLLGRTFAVRKMRPGDRPTERLEKILEGDLSIPLKAVDVFLSCQAPAERILVLIDQFEELFTHSCAEEQHRFIAALRVLRDDDRCYFVLALRADFYGSLMDSALWPEMVGLSRVDIAPLKGAALRRAIIEPALRIGVHVEARLGDRLVADAAGEPGALPLLQETLRMLWERRSHRYLSVEEYEALGDGIRPMEVAVAKRAETAMCELNNEQQAIARRVLLRLVSFGEGRTDTRRQVGWDALRSTADSDKSFLLVLQNLVQHRLVTIDGDQAEQGVTVDLSHEALLTAWPKLRIWIDERRDDEQRRRRLEAKVNEWIDRGRGKASLLDSVGLDEAMHWMQSEAPRELGQPLELPALVRASRRELVWRRRRTLFAFIALPVVVVSLLLAGEFRRQKLVAEGQAEDLRLAGKNFGSVEFVFSPFDLVEGHAVDSDARSLQLQWRVFGTSPDSEHDPGAELPVELVRRHGSVMSGRVRVDRAELPGGTAYLRIDGRGRTGEQCEPSWIRIRAMPGYADRKRPLKRIELRVPTCAASAVGMVGIAAGPFLYGGIAEPLPTISSDEPEIQVHLPAFAMERTEVSNGQFAPFAEMRVITGYPVPNYPQYDSHQHDGEPQMPRTAVDAFQAEAFCRFMGKRLPSDYEWVKAARGGLTMSGTSNPNPRRLYPWGFPNASCFNVKGANDGYEWVAPVDSFSCGASPYGILNLVGNVSEWISREGQVDSEENPMRVTRGGGADMDVLDGLLNIVSRVGVEGRQFNYATGFRCVGGISEREI